MVILGMRAQSDMKKSVLTSLKLKKKLILQNRSVYYTGLPTWTEFIIVQFKHAFSEQYRLLDGS